MGTVMLPSEELLALTKQEEGLRFLPYRDQVGLATVGYGHLIRAGENFADGITLAEADELLEKDMAEAALHVTQDVTVPMSQGEFDALCDFVYNLGDRLKSSTLLRLLNASDVAGAQQQLLVWDFAGGKLCAGLKARRVAELELWQKGVSG